MPGVSFQYAQILENCSSLRYMYENPDDIQEPVWFLVISMLASNVNTDDFIHWISHGCSKLYR